MDIVNNSFSDGEYKWSDSNIYHFKKYNIPLSAEFIEYFINHCKLGGLRPELHHLKQSEYFINHCKLGGVGGQ
nr:hypothetical protein [uncultured Ruminococcus sp.]